MKKSFLAIALTTALFLLAFSMEANATKDPKEAIKDVIILGPGPGGGGGVWLNGWRLNGLRLNGWHLNGIKVQATSMQVTKRQSIELQNLKVEGGQLVAETQVAAQ